VNLEYTRDAQKYLRAALTLECDDLSSLSLSEAFKRVKTPTSRRTPKYALLESKNF